MRWLVVKALGIWSAEHQFGTMFCSFYSETFLWSMMPVLRTLILSLACLDAWKHYHFIAWCYTYFWGYSCTLLDNIKCTAHSDICSGTRLSSVYSVSFTLTATTHHRYGILFHSFVIISPWNRIASIPYIYTGWLLADGCVCLTIQPLT